MAVTYYGGGQYAYSNGETFTIDWPTNGSDINYATTSVGANFITTPAPPQPSERQQVNSRTGTVQVKAGFLGQVYVNDPSSAAKVILWESSPKKTLTKADKAAKKAQLRAVERSFA